MGKRANRKSPDVASAADAPVLDTLRTAELLESCRAHAASISVVAALTSQALCEQYEYGQDEPNLGKCCDLVHLLLEQAQRALISLTVVSSEREPELRAAELAAEREVQERILTGAAHVIRAVRSTLGRIEPDSHQEIFLGLADVEKGICSVITGLQAAACESSLALGQRGTT